MQVMIAVAGFTAYAMRGLFMCIWKMLVSLGILVLLVACTAQAAEREQFIDGMQTWHGTWVENGLVWLDEPYDSKVQESLDVLKELEPPSELSQAFSEYLRAHAAFMYAERAVENAIFERPHTLQVRGEGTYDNPECGHPDSRSLGPSLKNVRILSDFVRAQMMDVRWEWEREYFRPEK